MLSIRSTKTGSGAIAVQVVRYEQRKVIIVKHIGSAKTEDETNGLFESAQAWIANETSQLSLFSIPRKRTLALSSARYVGVRHMLAYDTITAIADRMGFSGLDDRLLIDLSIMRIIEPSSKLRAITLLDRYFGIVYAERTVYRNLPKYKELKDEAEQVAVTWAKDGLSSDLSFVLYDVTTLYFETFTSDELRVPGFSKDSKSQQPQIVVGLLVTKDGFPLGYEVFKGNTFEGKTMLPMLESFGKRHAVTTLTVVADAAMISRTNVLELTKHGLSYIVGARLANLSPKVIRKVCDALPHEDGATTRIMTEHGDLIISFSSKRYRKDRSEMEKQIAKARTLVKKGEPGRRAKFVTKSEGKDSYVFDDALFSKTQSLLGFKGYYTNIPENVLSDQDIVMKYHDLWHVEAAFRMAKSDLATRPIFHHTEDAVRAHMVICFIALAIGKHIEITTGKSLHAVKDILWDVTDAHIIDKVTGEEIVLRSEVDEETKFMLKKLGMSY